MLKRILITGKSSYLGNMVGRYLSAFPDAFQVDTLSLRDPAWQQANLSGYDAVFHVAGIAHAETESLTEAQKDAYYHVNTELAVQFAAAAKKAGVRQFIHMSSMIVYGAVPGGNITPDTVPHPDSVYGDSKWQGEQGVMQLGSDGFRVAVIRAPMIYGPDCRGNYQALKKLALKLPIFPRVRNTRSMLYVGDLCRFVSALIQNECAGVFFPQNAAYVNTSDLVAEIARAHGKRIRLHSAGAPLVHCTMHLPGKMGRLAQKAFGSRTYQMEMSRYPGISYQETDFAESVRRTEHPEEGAL